MSIILCGIFQNYCAMLLLEVVDKTKARSFTDAAYKILGTKGAVLTNLIITSSQLGFVIAFLYFKIRNTYDILNIGFGLDVSQTWVAVFWFVLLTFFSFIKNIEIFAATHLFGDILVVITLLAVFVQAGIEISNNGSRFHEVKPIDTSNFSAILGSAVFAFEGIGVTIPLQRITRDKERFPAIIQCAIVSCIFLYCIFSIFCITAWGEST